MGHGEQPDLAHRLRTPLAVIVGYIEILALATRTARTPRSSVTCATRPPTSRPRSTPSSRPTRRPRPPGAAASAESGGAQASAFAAASADAMTGTISNSPRSSHCAVHRSNSEGSSVSMSWKQRPRPGSTQLSTYSSPVGQHPAAVARPLVHGPRALRERLDHHVAHRGLLVAMSKQPSGCGAMLPIRYAAATPARNRAVRIGVQAARHRPWSGHAPEANTSLQLSPSRPWGSRRRRPRRRPRPAPAAGSSSYGPRRA